MVNRDAINISKIDDNYLKVKKYLPVNGSTIVTRPALH